MASRKVVEQSRQQRTQRGGEAGASHK